MEIAISDFVDDFKSYDFQKDESFFQVFEFVKKVSVCMLNFIIL